MMHATPAVCSYRCAGNMTSTRRLATRTRVLWTQAAEACAWYPTWTIYTRTRPPCHFMSALSTLPALPVRYLAPLTLCGVWPRVLASSATTGWVFASVTTIGGARFGVQTWCSSPNTISTATSRDQSLA